tara:strand:- start:76 stop:906 length:831 start_codon:yes stop_codon:yes gene_type:complete
MISHEKKLVFIHVPKTGGMTLSKFLRPYCDEEANKVFSPFHEPSNFHARIIDYITYYGARALNGYTFFIISRNPYDKILSMHFHQNNNKFDREIFRSMLINPEGPPFNIWPHSHLHFCAKKQVMTPANPDAQALKNYPNAAQWTQVSGDNTFELYNELIHWPKVLKFEDYTNQVSDFLSYYGIRHDKEQLRKKTNTTDHKHYSSYLLADEVAYINFACGLDFQVFDYPINNPLQHCGPPFVNLQISMHDPVKAFLARLKNRYHLDFLPPYYWITKE